jgi:hypothetical protein
VTTLDASRNESTHAWPHFLPDGRHFLYLARSTVRENSGIYVGSVDSKQSKFLTSADSSPSYAAPGYLLFLRDRSLMAQPFNADKLQLTGEPFPIAEQVAFNPANGRAFFAVSDNGVLVYRTQVFADAQIAWFDRTGKQIGQVGTPGQISIVALSPDDKRVIANERKAQILEPVVTVVRQFLRTASVHSVHLRRKQSLNGSRVALTQLRRSPERAGRSGGE